MAKVSAHVQEYVGRYVVLATIVLLPASGLLGQLAAEWGGADTTVGRIVLGASSVLGTAAAVGVWLRNLGLWETAPLVGQAQGEAVLAAIAAVPTERVAARAPLEDPEADSAPGDVPDAVEFAAPPPPAPDETNAPTQPSQVGLTDAEADDPPRP